MNSDHLKNLWRQTLKERRGRICIERRGKAALLLTTSLIPILKNFNNVLSFASFGSEIDTSLLNDYLAKRGKLSLPKVYGERLDAFYVTNPSAQTTSSYWGIPEPDPQKCPPCPKEKIELVIVPALGFDLKNNRIGYGKGYYDRLLKELVHSKTIGIGFKEQLVLHLPTTNKDLLLEKVSLF